MFFVLFRKPSTSNFHDVSRIFPGYLHGSGSPSFGIYRIFTCFSYGLESLRLRISMIFPGYLHDFGSHPFGSYRIFTCFSYGLKSLRLRIFMIFPGYFQDISMVLAVPFLGFTGYLRVSRTVGKVIC